MAWDPLSLTETQTRKPITQALMRKIRDDLDYLYGQIAGLAAIGILNNNFEHDAAGDGVPDNWTVNLYPAGSQGLSATESASGKNALYFTHPGGAGNGGGEAESDYVEINPLQWNAVAFSLKCTNAATRCDVVLRYFDQDKLFVSEEAVYSSTANPIAMQRYELAATPPATARFVKVRLVGGEASVDAAGTVYFDNIDLRVTPSVDYTERPGTNLLNTAGHSAGGIVAIPDTTPVMMHERQVSNSGTYRVSFRLFGLGMTARAQIYVNNIAVGILRMSALVSVLPPFFAENITVQRGDRIQLYAWCLDPLLINQVWGFAIGTGDFFAPRITYDIA